MPFNVTLIKLRVTSLCAFMKVSKAFLLTDDVHAAELQRKKM